MLQGPAETVRRSRKLRQEMSLPEVLLWRELRKRPGGLKFRRQHPAGPYVADFFCHEARLVVEIDGEAHNRGDRPARDAERDLWFGQRRFDVLRVPAVDVLSNLEGVIAAIVTKAASSPERPKRTGVCGLIGRRALEEADTPPPLASRAVPLPLQGRI